MAAEERRENTAVTDKLFSEYYRFSFFNAVMLLEQLAPGKEPLGQALSPSREAVRFCVSPGFSFPASDVCGLAPSASGNEDEPPSVDVAFLGLIGPSGVLPHWYNELAEERKRQKDGALTAFFDLFHHRLLSFFYLAWKKHRFEACYCPGGDDRFSFYLRSLIGLGTGGLSGKSGVDGDSAIYFGGRFAKGVPTAEAVCAAVSYYFQVPASIDQFVGRRIQLAPEDRTAVGKANCRLGTDAICGSEVRESQSKFRINLGPMPLPTYRRFLPDGDRLAQLFALVRYQVGIEYEFDVRVILKREEVPPCRLGGTGGSPARLGWSTWIKAPDLSLADDPQATFQEEAATSH
jgi:type VI secretion system protein ImpH